MLLLQVVAPQLLAGKIVGRQGAVAKVGDHQLPIGHR